MRCFIAIDIDETVRTALGDLQQQLQAKTDVKKGDVKWVKPESVHLTLKFLGEIKDEQIAGVCTAVGDAVKRHKSFELDIESVGHFGGKSARVLWVGAGRGSDALRQLQKDIEQQLAAAGWPPESREFTGHLTLCRIRNSRAGMKLARLAQEYKDFKIGPMRVDAVSLYESQLTPSGPIYTVLANYELG
jgi:2'-5' RNA ligase